MKTEHTHIWGDLERSHLAGTLHRKCTVDGCRVINAYDDESEQEYQDRKQQQHEMEMGY